ncbi:MAG: hypothetical protein V4482_05030 [Pseudomonadota bacterium]
MQHGEIAYSSDDMLEITKIGELSIEIESALETDSWDRIPFFENFEAPCQILDKLMPKLTEIQNRLMCFNEKIAGKKQEAEQRKQLTRIESIDLSCSAMGSLTSATDDSRIGRTKEKAQDRSAMIRAFEDFALELHNPDPNTIEIRAHVHVKNLIQKRLALHQRTLELLESRIYTDDEKLILRPRLSNNATASILDLTRFLEKQIEVYQLAKEQLELLNLQKFQIQKRKHIDNLYVLLSTHIKSLLLENTHEIIYLNLIAEFYSNQISQEAKDFSDCMHIHHYEDYVRANPCLGFAKYDDKDIIYFFKHDTAEIEPTKSYKNLLDTIGLLKEQGSLKQESEITTIITNALTCLTLPFETKISMRMQVIDELVNKKKEFSMFRRIYLSLLHSFTDVSPILTEYQALVSEQKSMLERLLKKEPTYLAMQKKEAEAMLAKIMHKDEEAEKSVANVTKKKHNKKKKGRASATEDAAQIDETEDTLSSLIPTGKQSTAPIMSLTHVSAKDAKYEEKKKRQLFRFIGNEIDLIFEDVFTDISFIDSNANTLSYALLEEEICDLARDYLEEMHREMQEQILRREQVHSLLRQMISRVEDRPHVQDTIDSILSNIFKHIKCKAENDEYDTIMRMFSTDFRLVTATSIDHYSSAGESLSINVYERIEKRDYSDKIAQAEATDASLRAGQIENNLNCGRIEDELGLVIYSDYNKNTYLKEYKYARSWLRPYLITSTTQPVTELLAGELNTQYYRMLMSGFIDIITRYPRLAYKNCKINRHIYGHRIGYHPNNVVRHFAQKKTHSDYTVEISNSSSSPEDDQCLAQLLISEQALINFTDAIKSMKFYTAAYMFVSQLVRNKTQLEQYALLPERDWRILFSHVEHFMSHARPVYEKIKKMEVTKPSFFHKAYMNFSQLVSLHDDLKLRHEIKNYAKTSHHFLPEPASQEVKKEKIEGKEVPSMDIYNEFLLYFLNTPDDKLWNEKGYYEALDNFGHTYDASMMEYNHVIFQLQSIPDFQQALFSK